LPRAGRLHLNSLFPSTTSATSSSCFEQRQRGPSVVFELPTWALIELSQLSLRAKSAAWVDRTLERALGGTSRASLRCVSVWMSKLTSLFAFTLPSARMMTTLEMSSFPTWFDHERKSVCFGLPSFGSSLLLASIFVWLRGWDSIDFRWISQFSAWFHYHQKFSWDGRWPGNAESSRSRRRVQIPGCRQRIAHRPFYTFLLTTQELFAYAATKVGS
jgi:hypothetical protein